MPQLTTTCEKIRPACYLRDVTTLDRLVQAARVEAKISCYL